MLPLCQNLSGNTPLGPTTLLRGTDLLRQVAGWMALLQGEDLEVMVAVMRSALGVILNAAVYRCRMHAQQRTADDGFDELEAVSRAAAWACTGRARSAPLGARIRTWHHSDPSQIIMVEALRQSKGLQ